MHGVLRQLLASVACVAAASSTAAQCARFPATASTAFDAGAGSVNLPWRTDLPDIPGTATYAWQSVDFRQDWKGYMSTVLSAVKDTGVRIVDGRLQMDPNAEWWIAPWMDYGPSGRERINGLTRERGPDPGDLSPTSPGGYETWAIGWYNKPGAYGLGQVFSDPCNPKVPTGWRFPEWTTSFKLLFTNASPTYVSYLNGSPSVLVDWQRRGDAASLGNFRLIQLDIAVRDPRARGTNWVMGTYIWQGPPKGDGLFDNFVPVGFMWGNDHGVLNTDWGGMAEIKESKLNEDLAGVVWQGKGVAWPQRPFPGFQGRLNGPADNLRSSCLSCHAMAQWRRGPLGLTPTDRLTPKPTEARVRKLVADYFQDTLGGELVDPTSLQQSLDYSLQLETSLYRICSACEEEKLTGPTPDMCKAPAHRPSDRVITRQMCSKNFLQRLGGMLRPSQVDLSDMPRQ